MRPGDNATPAAILCPDGIDLERLPLSSRALEGVGRRAKMCIRPDTRNASTKRNDVLAAIQRLTPSARNAVRPRSDLAIRHDSGACCDGLVVGQLTRSRLVRQDVSEAILADLAAAEEQRSGKHVSTFRPSWAARCKAVAMLALLYVVVVPLSVAAVVVAAGLRLAWRMLAPAPAAEHSWAQAPYRGTALVSGAHTRLCMTDPQRKGRESQAS